jgi:hypothetical protein
VTEFSDERAARLPATTPGVSLLRVSAAARLGGALVVIAALWAATLWALN